MEISLIFDTLTTIATKYGHGLGLGVSNFVTDRHYSSHDQPLQIYALNSPIDAIAPPTIKPRTAPKKLARKRSRVVKRSWKTYGDDAFPGEDEGSFFDGGDGPFGGGGSGGDGGGSFDRFNWDESLPASDPAFDFVYEVLCWTVLSNCLHFAFKKVIRILADGVSDAEREKVALRFTPVC
ncbi:hypothetical protein L1987_72214 [Smallanthus sonchifolius]|uniref:Uncharacterized protein n=1 Tax=Smallanthus sonchifolius TaxID=185202 RepID=A0ACB9AUL7_9ASTR|nr:hypothetical protein L1987_72214 [Smallanthus sonchifolius]